MVWHAGVNARGSGTRFLRCLRQYVLVVQPRRGIWRFIVAAEIQAAYAQAPARIGGTFRGYAKPVTKRTWRKFLQRVLPAMSFFAALHVCLPPARRLPSASCPAARSPPVLLQVVCSRVAGGRCVHGGAVGEVGMYGRQAGRWKGV